jgi:hypothetical protein
VFAFIRDVFWNLLAWGELSGFGTKVHCSNCELGSVPSCFSQVCEWFQQNGLTEFMGKAPGPWLPTRSF